MAPMGHSCPPRCLKDLTLDEILSLPPLDFPDRQAAFYRLGDYHTVKVSTSSMLRRQFRASRLAYDLLALPQIPVMSEERTYERDGEEFFCVLMDIKQGIRLEDAWPLWDDQQKQEFWLGFLQICGSMAKHTNTRISSIDHGYIKDEIFDTTFDDWSKDGYPGPFSTEARFIEAISSALARRAYGDHRVPFACRLLSTMGSMRRPRCDESFTLTHGNFQGGHVLVSDPSYTDRVEITGILGWEQSGYYPGWWEMSKIMMDNAAGTDSWPSPLVDGLTNYPWSKEWMAYSAEVSTMMHVWNYIF